MNSREDILAEINMLKVLVWKLWEEAHGGISKSDWNDMKNIAMTGVGIYGVSKLDQAAAVAHKVYKRFGKASRYIQSMTDLPTSQIVKFLDDKRIGSHMSKIESIVRKKDDLGLSGKDTALRAKLNEEYKDIVKKLTKYIESKYKVSEPTASKLLKSVNQKKWNIFSYKTGLTRKFPRYLSKKLTPYILGSVITDALGVEDEGASRIAVDTATGLGARKMLAKTYERVLPKLKRMITSPRGRAYIMEQIPELAGKRLIKTNAKRLSEGGLSKSNKEYLTRQLGDLGINADEAVAWYRGSLKNGKFADALGKAQDFYEGDYT